ncbi:MAG: acyl carrier protein [Patulibacter minatonensis]
MAEFTREDIEGRIERALAAFDVDTANLAQDATLEELDIDSLDIVELSQILHDDYEIDIKPADFQGSTTYGDALAVVYRRAGL